MEVKKELKINFGCKKEDGQTMCKLMYEHAQQIVKAKTVAKKSAAQQVLESLKGAYTVTSKLGIVVRKSEQLDSELVAVVASEEKVDVIGIQMREGRTRVHVIAKAVKTCVHEKDPSGGTEKDVEGWSSIKNGSGVVLMVKDGIALDSVASPSSSPRAADKTKRIGNTGRRHSVSVGGVGNVTSLGESIAGGLGVVREKTFDVSQARPLCALYCSSAVQSLTPRSLEQTHLKKVKSKTVTMKLDSMAVRLFDGPKFLESHQVRTPGRNAHTYCHGNTRTVCTHFHGDLPHRVRTGTTARGECF
jgi:hypothetical protein